MAKKLTVTKRKELKTNKILLGIVIAAIVALVAVIIVSAVMVNKGNTYSSILIAIMVLCALIIAVPLRLCLMALLKSINTTKKQVKK